MTRIETERLIIRDNLKTDLNDLYELTTDARAMRFMKSTKITTRKEAKKNLRFSIRESRKNDRIKYYFAITDKVTNEYIGAIGYVVHTKNENTGKVVELGYFIKEKFWNKGYVTEAGQSVMRYAFEENNVVKIEASCLEENRASERIMIKLGLKKEGLLLKHQLHEGQLKNRLLYGIIKEEWLTGRHGDS